MKRTMRLAVALSLAGSVLALPATSGAGTSLPRRVARLNGDHPGATSPDGNAKASAVLKLDRLGDQICYRVDFENMVVRGVYLYRDGAERGDYFLKLYDEAPQDTSPVRGCISDFEVKRWQIKKLKRHPKRYFVNAWEYGGGDIAGGLRRP